MPDTRHTIQGIAHDVRGAVSLASLLAEGLEKHPDPDVVHAARRIGMAVDAVSSICRSAMRSGDGVQDGTPLDAGSLRGLIEDVASLTAVKGGATTDPAAISAEVDPRIRVRCRRSLLMRVLLNLSSNAATAIAGSGRGGSIRIAASLGTRGPRLDVIDDGPGLPPGVLSHFRPRSGPARPSDGRLGLGLPTSMRLAREIGASLRLLHTGERGTAFRLEFDEGPARDRGGDVVAQGRALACAGAR